MSQRTGPSLAFVVIDVPPAEMDATVTFWAAALDAAPQEREGPYVRLHGARSAVDVLVQRLDEGGPRIHLDVAVPDRAATRDTATASGGALLATTEDWDVLQDPAGLVCCTGFSDPDPPRTAPRTEAGGYLDAVFLDVPAAAVDAEVRWWAGLLAARVVVHPSEPAYRPLQGVHALDGTGVVVEVQEVGIDPDRDGPASPPRVHVDLSATDVEAEAARLEGLGARRIAEIDTWITLADPAGNLLCVVPRGYHANDEVEA